MAQSYLIFDFGSNEQAAQEARHQLEHWRQAFRLGKKLQLKFEREKPEGPPAKSKGKTNDDAAAGEAADHLRILVRLDFSDHERLSHHRWLERIPAEEPFKSVEKRIVRHSEKEFSATEEHFEALK